MIEKMLGRMLVFLSFIFFIRGESAGQTVVAVTPTAVTTPLPDPVVTVDLKERHGVWFEKQQDVCFPTEYVRILTRYEYGKYMVSVTTWLNILQQALGQFGSDFDSKVARENRVCQVPEETVCPVNQMKNLTKVAALKRNQVYQLLQDITGLVEDVTASFQSFPLKEASTWPIALERVSVEDNVARLPAAFSYSMLVDLTLFDVKDGKSVLPEKEKELESRLTQVLVQGLSILSTLNSLKLIIHNLDRSHYPTELVTFMTLASALTRLVPGVPQLPAVQYLETNPLTEGYQVRNTSVLENAVLEIEARFPAKDKWNIMQSFQLHVFPISRIGYIQELKWKKINVSSMALLISSNNASMVLYNANELQCLSKSWNLCRVCTVHISMAPLKNKCVHNLFKLNMDKECEYIEQESVETSVVAVSENKLAVLDNTPGSLIQSCSNKNTVFALQPAAMIFLDNQCSYELLDDEGDILFPSMLLPKNLKLIAANLARKVPNIVEDLNTIQQHFKTYGYIYVIAVGLGLLLLCSIILCGICCRCRSRRVRRRRQSSRDAGSQEQVQENRLLLRTLQPIANTLPSRFTSPRITETARGLVIETVYCTLFF